jgi:hypothetical protein
MGKVAIQRIINGFINEPFTYLEWYTWGKLQYLVGNIFTGKVYITKGYFQIVHVFTVILGVIGLVFMSIKKNYYLFPSLFLYGHDLLNIL